MFICTYEFIYAPTENIEKKQALVYKRNVANPLTHGFFTDL